MNTFSWSKGLGYGAALWVIMFVAAAILVALGITIGIGWALGLAALMAVLSYVFAVNTDSENSGQALGYGFVWAAVGIVLDLLITRQFQSNVFGMWSYWVGYAMVLLAPWAEYEIQGKGATNITA